MTKTLLSNFCLAPEAHLGTAECFPSRRATSRSFPRILLFNGDATPLPGPLLEQVTIADPDALIRRSLDSAIEALSSPSSRGIPDVFIHFLIDRDSAMQGIKAIWSVWIRH